MKFEESDNDITRLDGGRWRLRREIRYGGVLHEYTVECNNPACGRRWLAEWEAKITSSERQAA